MRLRLRPAECVLALVLASGTVSLQAEGIDLVTLPERSGVQLTIYNSADLTLVRDTRTLTLKKGRNRLSFDWANTLIDPTSLSLRAVKSPEAVTLLDVSYPPRLNTKAIWTVESDVEGEVPVEITFFTSGISWRAFYLGTLSRDEKTMRLEGYVRVDNRSGEEYENAVTRLIVGKIHLLDEIAALARQEAPYGKPFAEAGMAGRDRFFKAPRLALDALQDVEKAAEAEGAAAAEPKEIVKEGLSEYFLYTIEGTETIPDGWAKRLPSFAAEGIPVVNLYRFEEERFGKAVVRFLFFANDREHKLGDTPIPDGTVRVYRTADDAGHLSYEGASATKYIPVGQKAELELGPASDVLVEPVLMSYRAENFTFDNDGNVNGFDTVETYEVKVENHRALPVRVEVTRNFRHANHELVNEGDFGAFKKDDIDTAKYTLEIPPQTEKLFRYTIRYLEGERARK